MKEVKQDKKEVKQDKKEAKRSKLVEAKQLRAKRKEYTGMFYKHNHINFFFAIIAAALVGLVNLAISWLMQQLIDLVAGEAAYSLNTQVIIALGLLVLLILVLTLDYYVRPQFIKKAVTQYKDYAFEQITKKSISSFTGESTSTYISALTNDVNSIESNYLSLLFQVPSQLIMFFGAFIMMLIYSPLLTLAAFLFSAVPVVVSMLTGNRIAVAEKEVSNRNESFLGMVKDALTGFSVIKSFKAEVQIIKSFAENNKKTEDMKCRRRKLQSIINMIGMTAAVIAQFGVFIVGAYLAISEMGVTAGVVIVFVQLMNYILGPISSLPEFYANRKAAAALVDKLANAVNSNVRREGETVAPVLRDAIELKNITFGYEENTDILKEINVRFEAGKSYALVGASGSGKSTMLNLLMGSSENYEGKILFDGNELRAISSDSLYNLVSIVQQKVFIFNSSIRDNITMFHDFDNAKVDRAISMSGIEPLMKERGGDYLCGENGSGLSGGEQQRLSIARCLLHETPVMLVDEATAALDAETAFQVTNSLLSLEGITRIIVTHRLEEALLKKYDEILVLKNGGIQEAGSFAELMNKKGYFYSLFTVSQ